MAGTVMVRTTKVSSRIPTPITNPPWMTMPMLEKRRPAIEAAKMSPAAVITPPVELRVRMIPYRMLRGDSSRIRDTKSML
jgi:hypothetical protein